MPDAMLTCGYIEDSNVTRKASARSHPQVAFSVNGRLYAKPVVAARQLAEALAYRVDYMLTKLGNSPGKEGAYGRRKRLAKRMYPKCKRYILKWVRDPQ